MKFHMKQYLIKLNTQVLARARVRVRVAFLSPIESCSAHRTKQCDYHWNDIYVYKLALIKHWHNTAQTLQRTDDVFDSSMFPSFAWKFLSARTLNCSSIAYSKFRFHYLYPISTIAMYSVLDCWNINRVISACLISQNIHRESITLSNNCSSLHTWKN